jgi:hypothetical protein
VVRCVVILQNEGQEGGHVARSWSSGLREHFPASFSLGPCSALVCSPFTLQGRQVLRVIHFRYLLCECHQGRISTDQQRRTGALSHVQVPKRVLPDLQERSLVALHRAGEEHF